MADLTPNNREEHWLQGMVDGQTTLTPNNRREHWYEEIINASGGGGGGTGGGVLMVGISGDDDLTMDKTFGEIKNAILTTAIVFQYVVNGGGALSVTPYTLVGLVDAPDGKVIAMLNNGEPLMFSVETDNDYPTTGR